MCLSMAAVWWHIPLTERSVCSKSTTPSAWDPAPDSDFTSATKTHFGGLIEMSKRESSSHNWRMRNAPHSPEKRSEKGTSERQRRKKVRWARTQSEEFACGVRWEYPTSFPVELGRARIQNCKTFDVLASLATTCFLFWDNVADGA